MRRKRQAERHLIIGENEASMTIEITPDVAHLLGHYVYAYIDPRNNSIFYIGKGVGDRATYHLYDTDESRKVARIRAIRSAGLEPRIDIIAYGLRDELEALRVEAALIEAIGIENLTNVVHGWGATEFPRRCLEVIIAEKTALPADIQHPSLLIRINRMFDYDMDEQALYEYTRGVWVIGEERRRYAKLAMAVYAGIIRQVYEIESWHRAGSTPYNIRSQAELAEDAAKRWEFIGHVADASICDRYVGHSVEHYLKRGQQNPIVGVKL